MKKIFSNMAFMKWIVLNIEQEFSYILYIVKSKFQAIYKKYVSLLLGSIIPYRLSEEALLRILHLDLVLSMDT